MKQTPSEIKTEKKQPTKEELEVESWTNELHKIYPHVPKPLIEQVCKGYQLNPEKFDKYADENVLLPEKERDTIGLKETVSVFKNLDELKEYDEKKKKD